MPTKDIPLVTICIPTFNCQDTIKETVLSLLHQTYENIEIHISDNASTDLTLNVIQELKDDRIRVHRNDINVGAEGNFTRCMNLAGGDYTCIFHADDVYDQKIIEKQVLFLGECRDVEAVMTQAATIDGHGRETGFINMIPPVRPGEVRTYKFEELLKGILRHQNRLVISSLMVRSFVFKAHITWWGEEEFKSASDVDMYLKLAKRSPVAVIGDPLVKYRISENQFSEKIRLRTERPDFFLVVDSYMAQDCVANTLGPIDYRNYRWLCRHDRVARALNVFAKNDNQRARSLLSDNFSVDAFHAACVTRRGAVTLFAAIALKIVIHLKFFGFGFVLVKRIKKIKWQ